jgi:hypothetical protein
MMGASLDDERVLCNPQASEKKVARQVSLIPSNQTAECAKVLR